MVNTNAGRKVYICSTPQPDDLDATGFAALTWVEIKGVGTLGQTGPSTNILNYPTWDTEVIQKAKGMTDGGSPVMEVARNPTDAGQVALRVCAGSNQSYALKILGNDPGTGTGATPTITYNRGLVTGPVHPNGRNEDFDLESFTFGFQQLEVVVAPTAGT